MYPTTIAADSRTLWMGEIEHWMDENYISSLYASAVQGGLVSVKVIRDKSTGLPAGYSFVEFASHEMAQHVLNTYNGSTIPGTHKTFRLNWGVFGGGAKPVGGNSMQIQDSVIQPMIQMQAMQSMQIPMSNYNFQQQAPINTQAGQNDFSIYAGDIDPTVNDQQLADFFSLKYKTVISAKVIIDPQTKMGKGYGFVKFGDMNESNKALSEMNGALFRGRHIKTNSATWKSAQMANIQYQTQQINYMQDPVQQSYYGIQSYNDYQQQQYTQMVMQQQILTQQQMMTQYIQQGNANKHNNPQNFSKKVEKPQRPQKQREEYSENSVDFILNKIEYELLQKFIE